MRSEFYIKNKKMIIGIILGIIIVSSTIGILFAMFSKSNLHAPIIIESNEDFLNYNLPGNGTENNPFIIQDFRIGASGTNSIGISVSNTNLYFIIKNCIIYSDYIGINLMDVASGTAWIINNTCISTSGDGGGIGIGDSNNCTVKNNFCTNFMQGIHFNYVSHTLVKLNILEDNNYQGINIRYSSYNIIINNTIRSTPQHGIALVGNANWNTIYNNFLIDNAYAETYNVDGRLTGTINSQGFDEGNYNHWYNDVNNQGNWWSDYSGIGNYSIDGPAGKEDIYPFEIN